MESLKFPVATLTDSPRAVRDASVATRSRRSQEGNNEVVNPPQGCRVVGLTELVRGDNRCSKATSWMEVMNRGGITPGPSHYLQLPNGSYCEIRRKILDGRSGAKQVVWVRGYGAMNALRSVSFSDDGPLIERDGHRQTFGFFDGRDGSIFAPMIPRRPAVGLREWRSEAFPAISTFVHEREHAAGHGEYRARVSQDDYLTRLGMPPIYGDVERRLGAILGSYSRYEYLVAVGEALVTHGNLTLVPAPRYKDDPIIRNIAISLSQPSAGDPPDGVLLASVGLPRTGYNTLAGRTVTLQCESLDERTFLPLGHPIRDRIMERLGVDTTCVLRRFVGECLGEHFTRETLSRLRGEFASRDQVARGARELVQGLRLGEAHAIINGALIRDGGKVISNGPNPSMLIAGQYGPILRGEDHVTVFFSRGPHRGAALMMPVEDGYFSEATRGGLSLLHRDKELYSYIMGRWSGCLLWDECDLSSVSAGAVYLFPAADRVEEG